jgi:hypothetical protein
VSRERVAVALPSALLLAVAATQMTLAWTSHLSPWKGGGFGMFASVDGTPFRAVRIFVTAPNRSEELLVPPSLEEDAARAATFPHRRALAGLARRVAARERRHGRDVKTVRIEVWRTDYSASLDSTRVLVSTLSVPAHDVSPPRAQ